MYPHTIGLSAPRATSFPMHSTGELNASINFDSFPHFSKLLNMCVPNRSLLQNESGFSKNISIQSSLKPKFLYLSIFFALMFPSPVAVFDLATMHPLGLSKHRSQCKQLLTIISSSVIVKAPFGHSTMHSLQLRQ